MPKQNKKLNTMLVKIYELNDIREINIDLTNGKDRAKLKHILVHERHRLRKRDIKRYEDILQKSKT